MKRVNHSLCQVYFKYIYIPTESKKVILINAHIHNSIKNQCNKLDMIVIYQNNMKNDYAQGRQTKHKFLQRNSKNQYYLSLQEPLPISSNKIISLTLDRS